MAATSVGSLGNPYRWREVRNEEGLPVPRGEQFGLPVSFWNSAFGVRSKSSRRNRQDHHYRLVLPARRAIAFPWWTPWPVPTLTSACSTKKGESTGANSH